MVESLRYGPVGIHGTVPRITFNNKLTGRELELFGREEGALYQWLNDRYILFSDLVSRMSSVQPCWNCGYPLSVKLDLTQYDMLDLFHHKFRAVLCSNCYRFTLVSYAGLFSPADKPHWLQLKVVQGDIDTLSKLGGR